MAEHFLRQHVVVSDHDRTVAAAGCPRPRSSVSASGTNAGQEGARAVAAPGNGAPGET